MDMNKLYAVKNRSASVVVYNIPEDGIRRSFMPSETKRITFGELQKLSYQAGGREIMTNFLQIQDEEATDNLYIKREVEYDMSEEQIIELLRSGSMDALLDALDFAPIGVIDLIKTFSVQLPLNDMEKCNAIKEKTGFDVMAAIKNNIADKTEEEKPVVEKAAERRVKPAVAEENDTPTRRTTAQYKVVTPKA